MKLFTYGTLLIPKIMESILGFPLIPEESVYLKGYKISLTEGHYGYLICEETGNKTDIVPGFLVEVPDTSIERLDRYEGNQYKRVSVVCYSRNGDSELVQIYIKNKN